MLPIVCFIDDSPFELEVFERNIIPASSGMEFILGSTYDEVRRELEERYPCLFLLDLYGRDSTMAAPGIPSREEMESEIKSFASLDSVYDGLDDFPGDKTNEFLKRLFHITDPWRRLFYQASRTAGQNIKYGLGNLAAAGRDFPATAKIAYTRKSTIMDTVEVLAAGIDGLNLKPDGPSDEAINQATASRAASLLEDWSGKVTQSFSNYLQSLVVLLVRSELSKDVPGLVNPDNLSGKAQDLLGPGEMSFLKTAADWWVYIGHEPTI
ncbi:MAG: hypothetical protein SV487_05830 [Thermodesulfobacteriota bacterium]|nr:hypothetical protein [Thermodesulfobacteriota bacterium]